MRKIDTGHFRRATRTTSREINRKIVLNLVCEHQPISRAELARRMEVARAAVTPLVEELIADGVIREEEGDGRDDTRASGPRGRRPKLLYVRTRDRFVAAVDVRFRRTSVMLSDLEGREIALEETGRYLGIGLGSVLTALSPARIIVGGEITSAWNLIGEIVEREAYRRTLTDFAAGTPIIPATGGDSPRLRGATALLVARDFAAPRVA